MSDTVIVALISLAGIIITTIVSSNVIKLRLDSLEKKVDIHNGYAAKFGDIQTDIAVIKERIEHINESCNKN